MFEKFWWFYGNRYQGLIWVELYTELEHSSPICTPTQFSARIHGCLLLSVALASGFLCFYCFVRSSPLPFHRKFASRKPCCGWKTSWDGLGATPYACKSFLRCSAKSVLLAWTQDGYLQSNSIVIVFLSNQFYRRKSNPLAWDFSASLSSQAVRSSALTIISLILSWLSSCYCILSKKLFSVFGMVFLWTLWLFGKRIFCSPEELRRFALNRHHMSPLPKHRQIHFGLWLNAQLEFWQQLLLPPLFLQIPTLALVEGTQIISFLILGFVLSSTILTGFLTISLENQ